MSPRAYRMDARHAAAQETRSRILDASLRLLGSDDGVTAFTIDSVAREAGVARMTVYYQFTSKQGLLEAVYDELGARGLVQELPAVLTATNRRDVLDRYVYAFCRSPGSIPTSKPVSTLATNGAARSVVRSYRATALEPARSASNPTPWMSSSC
jgi:AcrR family transcriptional regulator